MREDPKKHDPFSQFLKPLDQFFPEKALKGFLHQIDELFYNPFPFFPAFHMDMSENDEEYIIRAELPDVSKEQIEIEVFDGRLTLSVENYEEVTEEDNHQKTLRRQQSMQRSRRMFSFASPIKEDQIKVTHDDRILTITVPKQRGKQIHW
jgi:HSP20 family protein